MKPKTFIAFAVVAVVSVAAAGIAVSRQPGFETADVAGSRLFPDVLDKVNTVAAVTVEQGDKHVTLHRQQDSWGLVERDGYPVRTDKVREVILGLAQLVAKEPKTRKKERYPKLELEDPESADAKSRRLTLLDEEGTVIARAIVGKIRYGTFAEDEEGVYVRKPGDAQAWLAQGNLKPGVEVTDWIKQLILRVEDKRTARVVIHQPDGETLTAFRASPGAAHLTVADLPADAKLKSDSAADKLASAFAYFDVEDVRKADSVPARDDTVHVDLETFDGLRVGLALTEVKDGETWVRFTRVAAEPGATGDKADAAAKEGGDAAKKATDAAKKAKDVAKEAADLAALTKGWAYRIADYKADTLRTRRASLIEKKKAAGS